MQVTNITVGYDRKRQPAQYESSGASVSFSATSSATVGDNEDYVQVARKLLGEAKTLVLTELGLIAAGTSASAHDIKPAANGSGAQNQQGSGEAGAGAGAAEGGKAGGKAPTTRKAAGAKDKADGGKPADPKPQGTTGDDIPDDTVRQITENPENRVAPTAGNSDIPEDPPARAVATATGDKVTHAELMAYISRQIADKKIDHNSVKALTATFNKPRIAEIAEADLAKYKTALDAKIAELNPADGL